MKIINPNWKSAIEKKANTVAPLISNFLAANPANRYVTVAELKAGLPDIANDLTVAVVTQACLILDLKLEEAEN